MFKTVRHVKRAPQVPSGRVSNVSPSLRNPSCKAVKTPSNQTGSDMLAELEKYTTVLPDSTLSPEKMTEAGSSSAVVNTALLSHILANTSAFYEFANAIEKGVAKASTESPGDKDAVMLSALTNIAAMLKDKVAGRISLEVDPRLAYSEVEFMCSGALGAMLWTVCQRAPKEQQPSAGDLLAQAKQIVQMCESQGLDKSNLLIQIPGTWAGIQAASALQKEFVDCALIDVYSVAQAAAAVQASVAVLVLNVTHVNVWYDQHPGAIRDPQGPRQDAGLQSNVNMGVLTTSAIYNYAQQQGSSTRIVVTGVRTADEVLALSGVNYMIVSESVCRQLAERGTLDGYNDGLAASADVQDCGIPALTPEAAMKVQLNEKVSAALNEKEFSEEMGMAGEQLLRDKLEGDCKGAERVETLLMSMVIARE